MPRYKAIYERTETKVITIYCDAIDEINASDLFDQLVNDSIQQEGDKTTWLNFDDMECIDAEDYVRNIQEEV